MSASPDHRFRKASNADAAELRALIFGVLAEYGLKPDPAGTDRDLADLEGFYFARGGTFELAVLPSGVIVGSAGLCPKGDGVCELRKMYLARDARGHGLGKELLARMLAAARQLGFRRVELETASVLTEAIALYTRSGFREIPSSHLAPRCDQAMALDL